MQDLMNFILSSCNKKKKKEFLELKTDLILGYDISRIFGHDDVINKKKKKRITVYCH